MQARAARNGLENKLETSISEPKLDLSEVSGCDLGYRSGPLLYWDLCRLKARRDAQPIIHLVDIRVS